MGYTGGVQANPTYRTMFDHTEALLVEFNPKVISYEDLLMEWSQMHAPLHPRCKPQYRSAVWYCNDSQRECAKRVVTHWQDAVSHNRDTLYTSIEPVTTFYQAEEYHQDFLVKRGIGGGGGACPF